MSNTLTTAAGLSSAIGPITATGLSLITLVMLILGVVGKGKKKLASGPAQIVGFFTEMELLRAGSPFHDIGSAFQAICQGIATSEPLHSPGMPAVCLLLLILAAFARIVPASGAFLGMLLAAACEAAPGSIWQALYSIASILPSLLGA